ncbi:MAG: hypothetical protein AVDCRST_MAG34-1391, partial [uncultured Nocardioidaceae bacterium]
DPPQLDRRAHGCPRHRGGDGRRAGARRRSRSGAPGAAAGRPGQHLPAGLRGRLGRRQGRDGRGARRPGGGAGGQVGGRRRRDDVL